MNKIYRGLEKKLGRYAVPNLTIIIIGCYVVGYILTMINPGITAYMTLEPHYILHGQIWRLITWLVIPPSSLGIFTIIMLFFYLSIGRSLEKAWGDFRYNVYIFGGIIITIIAAFICYAAFSSVYGHGIVFGSGGSSPFSTYYICLSIFLGFAATFPDAQVYLYFILPVKIKWLGFLYIAFLLYDAVNYGRAIAAGYTAGWVYIAAMAAAVINFVIFFLSTRNTRRLSPDELKRRREFRKAMAAGSAGAAAAKTAEKPGNASTAGRPSIEYSRPSGGAVPRHRCEICGKTDLTDPDMDFRFCSKCSGSHEYCRDHLFTHVHIQ